MPKAARRAGAPPHLLTLRGEWTRRSNEWRMERVTPDETSEAGTTWGFLTFLLLAVSCRSPSSGSSCLHSSSHLPSGRHEGTEWSEPEARVVNDMRWVSDKRMGRLEVVHSRLCPFAFHSPTFPAAINNNMNPRFSALLTSYGWSSFISSPYTSLVRLATARRARYATRRYRETWWRDGVRSVRR